MATGHNGRINRSEVATLLIAIGMIVSGVLGFVGVLTPNPLVIAVMVVVLVGLSFRLGVRWSDARRQKRADVDPERD